MRYVMGRTLYRTLLHGAGAGGYETPAGVLDYVRRGMGVPATELAVEHRTVAVADPLTGEVRDVDSRVSARRKAA